MKMRWLVPFTLLGVLWSTPVLGQTRVNGVWTDTKTAQVTLASTANGQTLTKILSGTGAPEGVVTAPMGSLYLRTNGEVYVRDTGSGTINTGWSLIGSGGGGSGDITAVTAGFGMDGGGSSGAVTIDFDPTEVLGSRTWGDASTDTIVWTFDRATGTDPTITFNSGSVGFQAISLGTPLTVPNGGTGAATITGLVLGNGASAMSAYGGTGACPAGDFISALTAAGVATCGTPASGSGDITAVVAGAGLTGGATTGSATLDIGEGLAIDAAADSIAFDPTELTGSRTWGDASTNTIVWTFDRLSGTDPTITFDSGGITVQALVSTTLDTGQGANELFDMDQNVLTTSSPTFVDVTVTSEAYDATGWNADNTVPTKDAVRDILETFLTCPATGGTDFVVYIRDSDQTCQYVSLDAVFAFSGGSLSLATVTMADGGTGVTSAADDTILVSNGTIFQTKAIADCDDSGGNHLNYDTATNAFSCGTSAPGGATLPAVDTTSIVEGSADNTKEIRFEVDGLTTGTVRVITAPDSNTTLPIMSQVLTFSGPTAARTYTLRDANTTLATKTGSFTTGNCVEVDANGEFVDAGAACGVGGGGADWDTIGDPSGNGTIDFGATLQLITSTLDASSGIVLEMSNTDAALTNSVVLQDYNFNDDAGAEMIWLRMRSDKDGTPATNFQILGTSTVGGAQIDLSSNGVKFTAADGALTILGNGNGTDENLVLDLDNVGSNQGSFSSTTGLNRLTFSGIDLVAGAYYASNISVNITVGGDSFIGRAGANIYCFTSGLNCGGTTTGTLQLGATGEYIRIGNDEDGMLIIAADANGNDEDFRLNLDDTANTWEFTSTTGVTTATFTSILVNANGFAVNGTAGATGTTCTAFTLGLCTTASLDPAPDLKAMEARLAAADRTIDALMARIAALEARMEVR